jgi:hypothetical protein
MTGSPEDPFLPARPPGTGWPPAGAPPPEFLDRLPALYRAEGGAFLPLLEAALGTLSALGGELRAAAGGPGVPPGGGGAGRGAGDLSGTNRGLLEFLGRGGTPPVLHPGMTVHVVEGTGDLEMVRSAAPAAVIAWPEDTEPSRANPARIPDRLVPPGVKLFSVRITGDPPRGGISGERFQGEII